MARLRAVWTSLLLLLVSPSAFADELSTARGQKLVETSHHVLVSLQDGVAKYRVRRTFYNQGTLAEEARLRIDLPHGAVATGLRIFAAGKWQEGDLMHRDKAEQLYQELTGLGPSRPKDPALLYWTWTSELGLRVFPIFPKTQSLVEYTLTVPTHYEGGEYFVSYPRKHPESPLATPVLNIESGKVSSVDGQAHARSIVRLDPISAHPMIEQLGRSGDRTLVRTLSLFDSPPSDAVAVDVNIEHTWAGDVETDRKAAAIPQPSPSQGDVATVAISTRSADKTAVRLGQVSFPEVTSFARVEVDLAERLSQLPKNHRVTFVLDLSHTMGSDGIEAQVRLARAYVAHVPGAHFALVGTARKASALTQFESASSFEAVANRLEKEGKLSPQNGSFLDRGVAAALELQANAPRKATSGTDAIVVFTDDRLRPLWNNELALSQVGQLPEDVVVHVVDVSPYGDEALSRDDDHRLFPLAQARGGIAVQSEGAVSAKWSRLTEDVLYLVRPNRLDHVSFSALGEQVGFEAPSLSEGEGIRWMGSVAELPASIEIRGQLWSKPLVVKEQTTEDFHRATAGFVFSLDHYEQLSELEQYVLATYAGAVSPVTSYLAIEPGVRPSTIGLEESASAFGSGSAFGVSGGISCGSPSIPTIDWSAIERRATAACQVHHTKDDALELIVDTNDDEIADVRSDKALDVFGTCVVEQIWKERLPGVRGDQSRKLTIRALSCTNDVH